MHKGGVCAWGRCVHREVCIGRCVCMGRCVNTGGVCIGEVCG